MASTASDLREEIRERYAEVARDASAGCGCSGEACCEEHGCCGEAGPEAFGAGLYSLGEQGEVPDAALLASLGCGNPVAVAELREGETVLDLGSGGGIDVILSAKRVGPTGRAFGLDMTDEMLALAQPLSSVSTHHATSEIRTSPSSRELASGLSEKYAHLPRCSRSSSPASVSFFRWWLTVA